MLQPIPLLNASMHLATYHLSNSLTPQTHQRLRLAEQLMCSDKTVFTTHPKARLTKLINSEINRLNKSDNSDTQLSHKVSTKTKLKVYGDNVGKITVCTIVSPLAYLDSSDTTSLIHNNNIRTDCNPMLVGSLCALLTGHTRLQLHRYKLGLTFTFTCICLGGDESPYHFVFECALHINIRNNFKLTLNHPVHWESLISFIAIFETLF